MDQANVTVHKLLTAGLIGKLAAAAAQTGIWLITGARQPLRLLLPVAVSAGFFVLIYRLLEGFLQRTPAQQDASNPLVIGIAAPAALSLAASLLRIVTTVFWSRMYSVEELAEASIISTYMSYAGLLSIVTVPCFAAAAGMLYWRAKHAPQ